MEIYPSISGYIMLYSVLYPGALPQDPANFVRGAASQTPGRRRGRPSDNSARRGWVAAGRSRPPPATLPSLLLSLLSLFLRPHPIPYPPSSALSPRLSLASPPSFLPLASLPYSSFTTLPPLITSCVWNGLKSNCEPSIPETNPLAGQQFHYLFFCLDHPKVDYPAASL